MDVLGTTYIPGDTRLIDQIVYELKSQGIFDQFRKECIADVDTKPAYQNLRQRVEGSVSGFLRKQIWRPDMNKNQVREMLRKSLQESGFLETGVERIVDQVVNPKINSVFLPKVEDVVYRFLGIEKPQRNEKLSSTQLRLNALNLLPTDLEAVSPESDMNDDFMDDEKSADKIDNGVGEKVETGNGDVSKMEDEESPPFEPLEEQPAFIPQEENSVDSHVSGFSGLASHDSNHSQDLKSTQMEISTQDSQPSKHSSDGNFSSAISDDNDSKLEICEDSHLSKSSKSHDSNSTFEINNHVDKNSKDGKLEVPKTEEKKDEGKKSESSRHDEKKESSKHEDKKHDKSKSSSSSSKHKSSRSDRKDDKDRKSDKKDHKDRHSSSKNHEKKDSKSSSSRSDKDKESKSSKEKTDREKESKSDKEKESKNDKEKESKNDKEKESKSDKDKENKERDKSKDRNKSSSSKHSSSSSRDKSSSRKDSHSKDRSSDKSKSSNKDSKPKEEKSKSHESSSQTDKHKHSHSDRRSSSSNHKDKKDGDKSKKRESKDDHYSSKLKKRERRSTDRDSSDGHSDFKSSSSNNQVVKQSEQKETSAVNSGGDSSNSEPTESEQHQHTSLVMEVQPEVQHKIKLIKPKFASNIHEARRLMKIRKQLDKIEKRSQLAQDLAINNPVLISQIQGSFNLVEAMSLESENISPENHKKQPNILKKSPIRIEIPKPKTPEKPKSPELVSPPLQNSVITMESWDALEAKFNEKLMNSAYGSYGDYGEEECDMDEYRKRSVCEEVEKKEESVTKDAPVENFETEKMEESSFQNKVQGEVVTEPDKVEQPSEISLNTEILTEQINEAPEIVEDNAEAKEAQPAKPENSVPISEPSEASKDIESEETHLEPLKTQEEPVVKPAELEEHLEEPGQSSTEQNPLLDLHFKSPDDCASFEHSLLPQSRRYLAFAADRIKHLEESIEHMSAVTNRLTPMSPAVGVKRKRKDRAVDTQNNNKRQNRQNSEMERMNRNNLNKKSLKGVNTVIQNESFSLPLSPAESDNSIDKKVEIVEKVTVAKTKPASHKKESQRYSSDDLYKPRPLITGSRRRGVRVENVQ